MEKAIHLGGISHYHLEAAIAAEYVQAPAYNATNWDRLLELYHQLYEIEGSSYILLNLAILHLEKRDYLQAKQFLSSVNPKELEGRKYLYYATLAAYEFAVDNRTTAIVHMEKAIDLTENKYEKAFLNREKIRHLNSSNT